jgi:hypothetical protein
MTTIREIDNIYLAAALTAYGGVIDSIDRTDMRNQKFLISTDGITHIWVMGEVEGVQQVDSPGIGQVITEFMSNTLLLPPAYPAHLRDIKAKLHNDRVTR